MANDFQQIEWNDQVAADCQAIVALALQEDLYGQQDWTTTALVSAELRAEVAIVAREPGIVAGIRAVETALGVLPTSISMQVRAEDGSSCTAGQSLAMLSGSTAELLTAERILLNLMGRLAGIATLTNQYVNLVEGTDASIYDTRKTTPGWRRLEKYAVHCGGARNHRSGLYDAVLIKDNHLAAFVAAANPASDSDQAASLAAAAVRRAREYVAENDALELPIEVEVDTLEQFAAVLPAHPDIVLLDNMSPTELSRAVALRNQQRSCTLLEASGGVTLETLREIAETGVDRISVGALTHSAGALDIGLDWSVAL